MDMENISIKKAAFINAISKYSTIFIGILFTAVLARLITPEDYGIVAVTTVFTTFFGLFADMGIGAGIVQNKDLDSDDVNGIYSFTVKIGFLLILLFSLFSIPLSFFYKDFVYIPIGILLSVSLFFSTLNIVPNALLLKQKQFVSVGVRTVIVCITTGIFGIILAKLGLRYYALIVQTILNAFFTFLWNYCLTKPKFLLKGKRESVNKIKKYSSYIFAFNMINYFARNSDNLLISKFIGKAPLGYYDKAYKLMLYPVNNLTHVITPVLHPILSVHQNDRKFIYEKYIQVLRLLSLLGIFITPFCYIASKELILIMFGNQWVQSVPCFAYMSLAIWSQMLLSSTGSIFQSVGDTKRLFNTGCINSFLTILFIVLGMLEDNINAVSRNIAISYNLQFLITFFVLIKKTFNYSFWGFIKILLPDFIILIIEFSSGIMANYLFDVLWIINSNVVKVFLKFSVMLIPYVVLLFMTKRIDSFLYVIKGRKTKK